jgi:periplasmic protein CpxP/Spy
MEVIRMKHPNTLISTLLIALFGLSSLVYAQEKGKEPPPFPGKRMIKELKLTEEQVAKIKKLHEENKPNDESFRANRAKLKEAHEALRTAMHSDAPVAELRAKFEAVQALQMKCEDRQAMAKQRFEEVLAIREILTPEQRKQFRGMMLMDSRPGFGGRGFGRRMGGGKGPQGWEGPPEGD